MEDPPDFDSVSGSNEEESVVRDTEPEFVSLAKRLDVALAGFRESVQSGKDAHGNRPVEGRTSALAGSVQTIRFIVLC